MGQHCLSSYQLPCADDVNLRGNDLEDDGWDWLNRGELVRGLYQGRGMVIQKVWKVWTRPYRENQLYCAHHLQI
jgi:hypothetical protein